MASLHLFAFEDLSHNLLAKLLKDGVQKALAEHPDTTNNDSVIDFYIIQTIRQYKANLPEAHAFRVKTEGKKRIIMKEETVCINGRFCWKKKMFSAWNDFLSENDDFILLMYRNENR